METHISDMMLHASSVSTYFDTDKHACAPSRTSRPRSSKRQERSSEKKQEAREEHSKEAGKKQQEACEKQRERTKATHHISVASQEKAKKWQ